MDKKLFEKTAQRLAAQHTPENEALSILSALSSTMKDSKMTPEAVAAAWEEAKEAATARLAGITEMVLDFVNATEGDITATECYNSLQDILNATGRDKRDKRDEAKLRHTIRQSLLRLSKTGKLRKLRRVGTYERINDDLEILDWRQADLEVENLILPFALSTLVDLHPGNIVLVAGARNAGKTAFLLNTIADNMHRYQVHYFNSEMGGSELKKRLLKFEDISIKDWTFEAYSRSGDFASVVKPGRGTLNVIDYLEVYKDFYMVGHMINEIWMALDGALAVIALQKPTGRDFGMGGEISLDKPRLAVAMDGGTIKIVKAKAWKGDFNPNGMSIGFTIIDGCKLVPMDNWGDQFK